ncbi:MAG: YbjN domain-containing protein [Patescibacteria group bacterium]
MPAIEQNFHATDIHPIDIVETLAEQCEWDFDRVGEDQIAMAIEAQWRTYSLSLAWSRYDDMLRLVCTFELNPPEERLTEFYRLLNLANDRVWGGGFTHWPEQCLVAFRYGLTLAGGAQATPEQVEAMVLSAVGLAEHFYPAFQSVCWTNSTAEESAELVIEEAYGTA